MSTKFFRRLAVGVCAALALPLAQPAMFAQTQLEERAPIEIRGDGGFSFANGVRAGNGTKANPYIIEGWRIDAAGADFGILLIDTNLFVVIRGCEVLGAVNGIRLSDTRNVTVDDCHVHDNGRGIIATDSSDSVFSNNQIEYNNDLGIGVFESQNIQINDNRIWHNWLRDGSVQGSWGVFADSLSSTSGAGNDVAGHLNEVLIRRTDENEEGYNLFERPIETPEENCAKILVEFPTLFVTSTPEAPQRSEPYCGLLLATMKSLPLHLLGRITQVIFEAAREEVVGLFTGVGVIRILNVRNLKFFADVVYHEIAHAIQNSFFQERQQSRWEDLFARSNFDQDNFASINADFFDDEAGGFFSYGMTNDHEDFATIFEVYTRSTFAFVSRAQRIEATTGKSVLLDKIRFVTDLFRLGSADTAYRHQVGWNSETGEVSVQIQTAAITLSGGIPVPDEQLQWATF